MMTRCECGRPAVAVAAERAVRQALEDQGAPQVPRLLAEVPGFGEGVQVRISREQAAAIGLGAGSAATKKGGKAGTKGTLAAALVADYCRASGYPSPTPEYEFHPSRKWRFDLCWPALMLAVEFQGGQWTGGRHTRPKGFASDCEKFGEAAVMGWRVLPITYDQLKAGLLWAWLDRLIPVLAGSAASQNTSEGR